MYFIGLEFLFLNGYFFQNKEDSSQEGWGVVCRIKIDYRFFIW